MYWIVRGVLQDRPGALAALAFGCSQRRVNILGLQLFPRPDGRVQDELVLQTPEGLGPADIEEICRRAGMEGPSAGFCSAHMLEDQPMRCLRGRGGDRARPASAAGASAAAAGRHA
jgi:hypothetical protein